MINIKEDPQLNILNHSCAHLLAQAIKHLYPHAKFWVGPVITDGFYYDMDLGDDVITEEDLPKIEKEMKKCAKDGKKIIREEISKQQALEMFADDMYKVDLINNMDESDTVITCYRQGDFVDLCRGPHVENTKLMKYFKLLKV
ncbi:MAG: threonine--tRNA ligase, partial [Erysipelotrichaceae bacterium]|nr:threonine--tRNA ligase [Erysipelotrichaceae bacterium]